jgi:hypothetical protein
VFPALRQKARTDVAAKHPFDPESALSKFIRIFRHNDGHRISASISCRKFKVENSIAADWHKLHITLARSQITLPLGADEDVRERPNRGLRAG